MNKTQEKIDSLIGKQIEKNGNKFIIKSGKETSTMVVFETDKYPITYHKGTLEFTQLEGVKVEPKQEKVFIPKQIEKPIKIESKMNTENNSPVQEASRVLPQAQSQNQVSIANALQGSAELRETLIATLNRLTSAKTEGEKKSAIEIAKAVSLVGKEVNELLKTGVRAVEVIKKI